MNFLILVTLSVFILPLLGLAQNQVNPASHPRVLEIERILQQDSQVTLGHLLKETPFFVEVKIIPLRRVSPGSESAMARLPFFEGREEIRDEWDDPARTDFELLQRVQTLQVRVHVPDYLPPDQVSQIQQSLMSKLPFVAGRDSFEVITKPWPKPPDHAPFALGILAMGVALILVYGVMYFFISWANHKKLLSSLSSIKIQAPESSGGGAASLGPLPQMPAELSSNRSGDQDYSKIQIQDTIKLKEVLLAMIQEVRTLKPFPTLKDMSIFEESLKKNPKALSALMSELPPELKNLIFSYTYSDKWLGIMNENHPIEPASLDILNLVLKQSRAGTSPQWHELLTLCWRSPKKLNSFLSQIDRKDALSILRHLPQSISVGVARDVFPGEWAIIFKNEVSDIPEEKQIKEYCDKLLALNPLRDLSMIETYQRDLDLLKFLRTLEPSAEKEVYRVLPKDSQLLQIRPPFFPLFELTDEELKKFIESSPILDLATALFNISPTIRKPVEALLTEKQRARFIDIVKKLEKTPDAEDRVFQARERIGKSLQALMDLKSNLNTEDLIEKYLDEPKAA